jgi:hypothetical protein
MSGGMPESRNNRWSESGGRRLQRLWFKAKLGYILAKSAPSYGMLDSFLAQTDGSGQSLTQGKMGGINNIPVFNKNGIVTIGKLYQRFDEDKFVLQQGQVIHRAGGLEFLDFPGEELRRFRLKLIIIAVGHGRYPLQYPRLAFHPGYCRTIYQVLDGLCRHQEIFFREVTFTELAETLE